MNKDLATFWIAISGVVFGLIACVLGIFNSWKQWDRDRIKLRISSTVGTYGEFFGSPSIEFTLEVGNLGNFAITIVDAGILFNKSGAPSILFSQTVDKGGDVTTNPLPIRLEPYDVLTLTGSHDLTALGTFDAKCAYVRTAYGIKKVKLPTLP